MCFQSARVDGWMDWGYDLNSPNLVFTEMGVGVVVTMARARTVLLDSACKDECVKDKSNTVGFCPAHP